MRDDIHRTNLFIRKNEASTKELFRTLRTEDPLNIKCHEYIDKPKVAVPIEINQSGIWKKELEMLQSLAKENGIESANGYNRNVMKSANFSQKLGTQ
mmetsp:Transcript_26239/g.36548  ORF Transcript_26239/g.36548 Transcript_26239/m.36548 type:complete len:97 (+) Transcript_26239:303-593(+)